MDKIVVSLQVYEERPVQLASGGLAYKQQMAFWMKFPDGTCSWSHNRANVRSLAREYGRTAGRGVAIDWTDCGTYDP